MAPVRNQRQRANKAWRPVRDEPGADGRSPRRRSPGPAVSRRPLPARRWSTPLDARSADCARTLTSMRSRASGCARCARTSLVGPALARLHALLFARRASRSPAGGRRCPPARRRARRHRARGGRRRPHERASASRRLPRRQPFHDLGVQVRPARGGRQATQTRLAGTRGAARAGDVGRSSQAPASSPPPRPSRGSSCDAAEGDRRGADAAPAARPRRPRAERRADRRARRAARHHPRRAVQDAARRPAEAAPASGRARALLRHLAGGDD